MLKVFFNGPSGKIEGRYAQSPNNNKAVGLALLLHSHPQLGGSLNDSVIYNLYHTLYKSGFSVLRINFRGAGNSQGEFDNGVGELIDAATALDWLQLKNPVITYNLVAGFSFGAWIGMQLIMRRPEINSYIAVSPPVNKFDFSFLSPCPIPGLIIQGDLDSVVPQSAVVELSEKLSQTRGVSAKLQIVQGADHFFRNKLDKLNQVVKEYINNDTSSLFKTNNLGFKENHTSQILLD